MEVTSISLKFISNREAKGRTPRFLLETPRKFAVEILILLLEEEYTPYGLSKHLDLIITLNNSIVYFQIF